MIGTWFGKDIETLNKEELLEVIKHLGKELQEIKNERDSLGNDYYDLLISRNLNKIKTN